MKKGYRPKNYADFNTMDYVYGDIANKKIVDIACGYQHTVAVTEEGEVYTWGLGKSGALGHGNYDQVDMPKKVEGLANIKKVQCGNDFTIVEDKDNNLYAFGSNRYGQLGITGVSTYKQNRPIKMQLPHGISGIADFSCGEEHCAFLTKDGKVYIWGYGNDGQLGTKDRTNSN